MKLELHTKSGEFWKLSSCTGYFCIEGKFTKEGRKIDGYCHDSDSVKSLFQDFGVYDYKKWLTKVYGHTSDAGNWPEWNSSVKMEDVACALRQLQKEQCSVELADDLLLLI